MPRRPRPLRQSARAGGREWRCRPQQLGESMRSARRHKHGESREAAHALPRRSRRRQNIVLFWFALGARARLRAPKTQRPVWSPRPRRVRRATKEGVLSA